MVAKPASTAKATRPVYGLRKPSRRRSVEKSARLPGFQSCGNEVRMARAPVTLFAGLMVGIVEVKQGRHTA